MQELLVTSPEPANSFHLWWLVSD